MNEENSYESDISEGWSLIDINLNEESMNTSDVQSLLEKRLQPDLVNSKLKEARSLQSINSSENKLKNKVESSSSLNNSSYDDSPLNQEIVSNCIEILTEGKDSTMSEPVNDSCDAESIEILDIDGNYPDSDIDNLDVAVIHKQDSDGSDHSSNKESLCEEYNTHHFSGLRRKRRKLSRDSESSVDNFHSEITFSDGRHSCKTQVMKIQTCKQHVYRHYRNNVANTVLNLSMRIIFAGVACIAIGHFLGVHDGEGTTGELYDTLKKVQMENIALQSRLSQLNRAFFTREVASKWESTFNKSPCYKNSNFRSEKSENDPTSQPEVQSDFNSVEWFLKVYKLLEKECKNKEMVDVTKITNYIHNLSTFLRNDKNENNKIRDLEETNAKISKLLQKMVVKLSSSQENLENLYSRFLKLKDKFNKKVNKFFPDLVDEYCCHNQECACFNSKVEKTLNSVQWNPVGKTTQSTILTYNYKKNPDTTVSLCIFPQLEEYYLGDRENFSKQNTSSSIVDEEVTDDGNMNEKGILRSEEVALGNKEDTLKKNGSSVETDEGKREKESKIRKKQKEKKVVSGKTKKNINDNEGDSKAKQSNTQHRHNVCRSKTEKVKKDEKTSKKKFVNSKEKYWKKNKRGLEEEKGNMKKHFKTKKQVVRHEIKVAKRKRKTLNLPKEFWTNKGKQDVWLEREQLLGSQFHPNEKFNTEDRISNGKFVNFTGDWFFRLSEGRDEFRRQEILSNWQFERAKARMGLRNGDKFNTNWLFLRALAREDGRMEKLSNNRK